MAETPQEMLDKYPVQTIGRTAIILGLLRRNGDPNLEVVRRMVRAGHLRLVDPTQPVHRWTIASTELRRYIAEGPRMPEAKAS